MTDRLPRLYAHPFSSYCQKVLVALYENDTPFDYRHLEDPQASAELAALWPMKRFPVLVEGERVVLEATCIIEYLNVHHAGAVRLIPEDRDAALEVRMLDRFFDNYVSTPQQKCVFDRLCAEADRDPHGVAKAHTMLETAYAWLDPRMATRTWAAGEHFSLADCAAAPIASGCWRDLRSAARWRKHAPIVRISRWAHPIAIEPFAGQRNCTTSSSGRRWISGTRQPSAGCPTTSNR